MSKSRFVSLEDMKCKAVWIQPDLTHASKDHLLVLYGNVCDEIVRRNK